MPISDRATHTEAPKQSSSLINEVVDHVTTTWKNVGNRNATGLEYAEVGAEAAVAVVGAAMLKANAIERGIVKDLAEKAAEKAAKVSLDVETRYARGMEILVEHKLPQMWEYRGAAANPIIQSMESNLQPDAIQSVGAFARAKAPSTIDRPLAWEHQMDAASKQSYMIGQSLDANGINRLTEMWKANPDKREAVKAIYDLSLNPGDMKFETLKWAK